MRKSLNLSLITVGYLLFLLLLIISPSLIWFPLFTILLYFLSKPKYVFSPKSIVFAYYFLWFGLAPLFAQRYSSINVESDLYFEAYLYLSTSYYVLFLVSEIAINENKEREIFTVSYKRRDVLYLSILTLLFLLMYVQATGGISYWSQNLDRAFLTRQGAGVYYLGFSLLLPLLIFLISTSGPNKISTLFLLLSILVLSPLIGSKQKIIFFFLLVFYNRLYYYPVNIKNVVRVTLPVVGLFVLGNYFRNSSWMTWSDVLSYSLNYFDTLDSLFIVLSDFSPYEKLTTFLPFNKFYNLFTGEDQFFDVSAYLTSIYFPHAWEIRATVQFPVEADLYLGFGYFWGVPFLVIFYYLYCRIYSKSLAAKTPMLIYVWMNLFVYILSHLRGGVILWTDFYVYPFMIFVYYFYGKRVFYVRRFIH